MIRSITYRLCLIFSFFLFVHHIGAQHTDHFSTNHKNQETNKRVGDYLDLLQQGFSENEIFQDLGNANLLAENYEAAVFWYEKLLRLDSNSSFNDNYQERYRYALGQLQKKALRQPVAKKNWETYVKADYIDEGSRFKKLLQTDVERPQTITASIQPKMEGSFSTLQGYVPSMATTKDGRIGYFSKAVYKKPLTGIFSKRQLIHEIYRAENINGEWKNVEKVTVCPEYFSAKHPTISEDGARLFFASDMPGSYGKYDIYVADIKADGSFGIAKNLGPKVNTKKDEGYPNLFNETLLFFASEGREGYGGLDLYAAQVAQNTLTTSVNLGSHINSSHDEYTIALNPEKGMGYVVSNRGDNNSIEQYAISYGDNTDNTLMANREEKLMNLLNNDDSKMEYSNTVFENE
ncbi:cell envelope biogenesis protein OmpA [Allomuricauda sp. SCSIO 65647]|uniref:cell envelope biogenesis protein OmpA n=1 Tax=Allomuricauda sp. SCSIO 65647 TaxID=2908843 RepID=UPI001F397D0C|nr:cell envelope biogenesis protein OmpA [Muricauda sp. SCSIO 65647]UJH67536.1 cell envelope biogenesis protein OmpA [Muricauda sp. SCSIO 65647]